MLRWPRDRAIHGEVLSNVTKTWDLNELLQALRHRGEGMGRIALDLDFRKAGHES